MKKRIDISHLEPQAYKAMFELEKYLNDTELDKSLRKLIKIRASQINRCAYCIEMHTKDALENGEDQRRIFALSAWRESPLFSEKEKAVLKMTEEISLISHKGLKKKTSENIRKYFSDNEIIQIIMQIGTINTWNRIVISTHMFHQE